MPSSHRDIGNKGRDYWLKVIVSSKVVLPKKQDHTWGRHVSSKPHSKGLLKDTESRARVVHSWGWSLVSSMGVSVNINCYNGRDSLRYAIRDIHTHKLMVVILTPKGAHSWPLSLKRWDLGARWWSRVVLARKFIEHYDIVTWKEGSNHYPS